MGHVGPYSVGFRRYSLLRKYNARKGSVFQNTCLVLQHTAFVQCSKTITHTDIITYNDIIVLQNKVMLKSIRGIPP